MFCKWCGNTIHKTDSKCPTCGRNTPPMSDCGGLYDLKFSQIDVEEITKKTNPTGLVAEKTNFSQKLLRTFVVLYIIILLVITLVCIWRTYKLEQQIQRVSNNTVAYTETNYTDNYINLEV